MNNRVIAFVFLSAQLGLYGCGETDKQPIKEETVLERQNVYNVGFLIMDGVYNTELTAPFDIFQHTSYREGIIPMRTFTVARSLDPVTTFEGLRIIPDYSYADGNYPGIDILVVPSAEHHMGSDLENSEMIHWVKETASVAMYVTSHCDGAFVLAKAGLLDSISSTTFPSDVTAYRNMFPQLEILDSVLFVHDGKYITSAGGAKSFEAALYLCEILYGKKVAERLAQGLVIDWNLEDLAYYTSPSAYKPKNPHRRD